MKRFAVILLTVAGVTVPAGAAFAAWTVSNLNGRGTGAATAVPAISAAATATPSAVGSSKVRVAFIPVSLSNKALGSHTGGGYKVKRYATETGGTAIGTATACSTSPCDVADVPDGTWYFDVTPVLHDWRGTSTSRARVTVATAPIVTIGSFTADTGKGNTKFAVSGTASPGAGDVKIYFCTSQTCTSANAVRDSEGGRAIVGANGTWTYTSGNLGSGTFWVTAEQTNAAGATGSATSSNSVTR